MFQGSDGGQGEGWLVLTDPSLQEERPERPCRRTAALCVSTSCVLTSSVVRALKSSAACRASFRDVIREHGRSLLQISAADLCCRSERVSESRPHQITQRVCLQHKQQFGSVLFIFYTSKLNKREHAGLLSAATLLTG